MTMHWKLRAIVLDGEACQLARQKQADQSRTVSGLSHAPIRSYDFFESIAAVLRVPDFRTRSNVNKAVRALKSLGL